MTARAPRYVKLCLSVGSVPWWKCVACGASAYGRRADTTADRHARACRTVRIAMERDHCKRTLGSCEAAYAEATRTLRRQRDEAREGRDRLADLLAEAHAERDRMAATIGRLTGELETARQQVWALIGETAC